MNKEFAQYPHAAPEHEGGRPSAAVVVPSLVKWTGSKRSQATRIAALIPSHARYFEPFLGGGALLYLLACPGAVGGDIFSPLILLWKMVRDEPEHLISDYADQWAHLQTDLPNYYYLARSRFNREGRPEDLNFLMRTCVNGIVRMNRNGHFNNSFHLSRRGMHPNRFANVVRLWAERIQDVEFRDGDFEDTVSDAKCGDFVYLDPPYAGNRDRYIANLDLARFFGVLDDLNRRAVKWAVSFDGNRGATSYSYAVPSSIYKRRVSLNSGYSAVSKVLNGPVEMVTESLYLNY